MILYQIVVEKMTCRKGEWRVVKSSRRVFEQRSHSARGAVRQVMKHNPDIEHETFSVQVVPLET